LGNITIGSGSLIGAGSVVIESVPENCTVVGVPGEVVKRSGTRVSTLNHADLPDPVKEVRDRLGLLQKEVDVIENVLKEIREKSKTRYSR
jgi:serine O-acetyltransferase